jgi:hypothetical protein
MRVLRAPTWERIISAEEVEHLLPAAPRQHILPQEVLSTLESITDTTIVFSAPSEFLRSLRSGDVLIATATDTRSGFLRTMTGFSIDENNHLIIATTPAQASDLIPRAPSGNRIEKRIDVNGNPEYFYVTQEEVINYKEGPETTVMLYTFLSDHELLITTNEDVVDAVVERLGEKDVQK